ncbi:MAG: transposase [Phormidium sp.]
MDEISQRKGYRDFITMIANAETGNLLEVIDSHKQDDIIEALKQQPLEVRAQVEEVSVDMWGGFPKVIAEVFPNAAVVIDRFHVMKLVNQGICNYFISRTTSGVMEGINNKAKLMGASRLRFYKF